MSVSIKSKKSTGKILFGADPECFASQNGFAIPPFFFRKMLGVPASADEKHPVFLEKKGVWKAHEDGAAFEFAVRPSHDPKELFDTIQEVRQAINSQILSQFPQYVDPELRFIPTIGFEVERWDRDIQAGLFTAREFEMSTRFGCDPDEDAFDTQAARVMDVAKWPWRYAGGHIHVSGSPLFLEDPYMAIHCMAMTAGLAAVAFSPVPELEKARTYRYGRPGKFRQQFYGADNPFGVDYAVGVEYRTPSATWAGNWDVAEIFLRWVEIGIYDLLESGLGKELSKEIIEPTCRAILEADQPTAHQLLSYVESRI